MDNRALNAVDDATRESLKTAIKNGDADAVKQYLQNGGSVNAFMDNDKNTLLHLAVAARKLDIVQLLVNVPGVNLKPSNIDGQTPSQIALQEKGNKNKAGMSYKDEIAALKTEFSALAEKNSSPDILVAAEKRLKEKETLFEVNTDIMAQFSRIYRTLEDSKSVSAAPAPPGIDANKPPPAQVKLPFFLSDKQKEMKKSIDTLSKASEEIAGLHAKLKGNISPQEAQKIQKALAGMLDRFAKEKTDITQKFADWIGTLKRDDAGNYKKSDQEAVRVIRAYFNQEVVDKYAFLDPLRESLAIEKNAANQQREEIRPVKTTSSAPGKLQSEPTPDPDVPRTKLGSIAAQPTKPTIKIPLAHPRGTPNAAPPPPPNAEQPNPEALRRSKEAAQRKSIEQKQPETSQRQPADLTTMRKAFEEQFLGEEKSGPQKPRK